MQHKLVYLVHDINDAAVAKRQRSLSQGKYDVFLLGFERTRLKPSKNAPPDSISLGKTENARFFKRIQSVIFAIPKIWTLRSEIRESQVMICRNLEMLLVGIFARFLSGAPTIILYECLDVHRIMTRRSFSGRLLRSLEMLALYFVHAVIVSSSAFVECYFLLRQPKFRHVCLILENKTNSHPSSANIPMAKRPLRIGWFGVIRCRKSFEALSSLCLHNKNVEVIIAGTPFLAVFPDLAAEVSRNPSFSYLGPYDPSEITTLYNKVDLSWTIDFFEEGYNSVWLLPNRLYESLAAGRVPIGVSGTETAAWLEIAGLGIVLRDLDDLGSFFATFSPEALFQLKKNIAALDPNRILLSEADTGNLRVKLDVLTGVI